MIVRLVYDDGGVRYPASPGSLVVRTTTGARVAGGQVDARGVVSLSLPRGKRVRITAQAVVGDCAAGSAEQLVLKRDGYVTTPSAGPDPDHQTLPLPIVQRIACPVPDLP